MLKTVGIPAYNEGKSIKKTIQTILPQLEEGDELLVIASACTDDTVFQVKSINDPRIKIIEETERAGKVAAINKIMRQALNEIIIMIDADVIIAADAIKIIENTLRDEKVAATCGKVASYRLKTLFDKIQNAGWIALNEQKIAENNAGKFWALNGYLVGVKKSIAPQIDTKFLLDDALVGWLIKKQGHRVIYQPQAVAYVLAVQSISDFIKQKARNRIGWWQLTREGMKISERRNLSQIKYIFKNPYTILYIILDIMAWTKAWWDFKHNRTYWEKIESSKI